MAAFVPGVIKTFVAEGSISAYMPVYLSSAGKITHANTTSAWPYIFGVSMDGGSAGAEIPVQLVAGGGTAKVYFQATCTAGAFVGIGTTGCIQVASITQTSHILGICNASAFSTGVYEVILGWKVGTMS